MSGGQKVLKGMAAAVIVIAACVSVGYAGVALSRPTSARDCSSAPAAVSTFNDASAPDTTTTTAPPCVTVTSPVTTAPPSTTCTQPPVAATAVFTGVAGKRFYGFLSAWSPTGAKISWSEVAGSQTFSTSAYAFLWKGNGQFSLTLTHAGTPIAFRFVATAAGCASAPGRITIRTGLLSASLAANPNAGPAPLRTGLSDVGSSVRAGDSYHINFGDKTAHTALQVGRTVHTYTAARTYAAVVTVRNEAGQTAAASITLDTRS